jgi:hypothetical protein
MATADGRFSFHEPGKPALGLADSVQYVLIGPIDFLVDALNVLFHLGRGTGGQWNEFHQVARLTQEVLDLGNV